VGRRRRRKNSKPAAEPGPEQGDLLSSGASATRPRTDEAKTAAKDEAIIAEETAGSKVEPDVKPDPSVTGEKERRRPWGPARRSVTFEIVASEPDGRTLPTGERLARAKAKVQDGRVEEAAELYRSVLAEDPANLKARNNLGALYGALGQHDLALEQFEAAARLQPDNVEVLNNLSSTLALLGRYEEAEAGLRRALRLAPDDVEVHAGFGILWFRRGVYVQAEAELRWVCERDPEHGTAFFYRGEALNRLGRIDEAMEVLERATVLQPTNAKAFYTLGILYDRKHLPEEAAVMFRRSRELQRR